MKTRLSLFALAFLSASAAHATITVVNYWNMDQTNQTYTDSVSGADFNTGFGTRTSSTSITAPGSTGSVYLGGNAGIYSTSTAQSVAANNYVFEIWVNASTLAGYQTILDMGNGAVGSIQIGTYVGDWYITSQSSGGADSGVAVGLNTWTNLAVVVNNGVGQLYVNGTAISTAMPTFTFSGAATFLIGASHGGGNNFNGYVDSIRYSTFAPGQFSASDLMVNAVPEPGTYGLAAAGVVSLAAIVRRRRRA